VRASETQVVFNTALQRCDMTAPQLVAKLRTARWSIQRLADELEALGWTDRLDADVEHFSGPDRVRRALQGGPVALADKSDDELTAMVTSSKLRAFAAEFGFASGALVTGPTGVGKTVAAFLAARRYVLRSTELTDNGFPVIVWAKAVDIGTARGQHKLGAHEAPLVEAAKHARVLVLDDLGWEKDPEALLDVLAHRYDFGAFTLVTSGQSPDALVARYGEPAIRRIYQVGGINGPAIVAKREAAR
jgi:hypothetical protein